MKQQLNRWLLFLIASALISSAAPGCKSKVKDEDVRTEVQSAFQANPETAGLMVDVKDGVATVSGEAKDEAAKSKATELATSVKGVKSVQNNVTITTTAAPPVQITADDQLTSAVQDAIKDYPTVKASVSDGVISLTGEIKTNSWRKLKMALDGLKPKRVDASGLKITN